MCRPRAVDRVGSERRPPRWRSRAGRRTPRGVDSERAGNVLRQRNHRRRSGSCARLHRGAAAGRPRGPDGTWTGFRSRRNPRRGPRRLPGDERPRGDQGDDRLLMAAWASDELSKIGAADELELASARGEGTLRKPVTIWVVRHGDDLYVRSVNGRGSSWFRGVQVRHEGHIRAGGVDKDVLFTETDDVKDEVDAEYRTKYRRYAGGHID